MDLSNGIFECPSPSRSSIVGQLKRRPVHECGLTFENTSEHSHEAEAAANEARRLLDAGIAGKLELFLTAAVRERLEQGKSEQVISDILDCKDVTALRSVIVDWCLRDPSIAAIINRYLKRIRVKEVSIGDFRPSLWTIEEGQIAAVASEFETFLKTQLESIEADEDALPMLKLK